MENSVIGQKIGIVVFCIVSVWATLDSAKNSPLKTSDNCIHGGRVCPSKFTVYANQAATLKIDIKLKKNENINHIKVFCDNHTKLMVKVEDFNIKPDIPHDRNVTGTSYFGDRLKKASIERINSTSFQLVIVINNIKKEDNEKLLIIALFIYEGGIPSYNKNDQKIALEVLKATTTKTPTSTPATKKPTSTPTTTTTTTTTPDTAECKVKSGLTPGEIAGIVVGVLLAFIIAVLLTYIYRIHGSCPCSTTTGSGTTDAGDKGLMMHATGSTGKV